MNNLPLPASPEEFQVFVNTIVVKEQLREAWASGKPLVIHNAEEFAALCRFLETPDQFRHLSRD